MPNTLYATIMAALKAYLDYTRDHERLTLPPRVERDPSLEHVYASDLGYCPRKAAQKRHERPAPYPDLEPSLIERWKMQHGNLVASFFQEAMLWQYPTRVWVEENLRGICVTGRADLLFQDGDIVHVIEIKNVMEVGARWKGLEILKLGHVLQASAYGQVMDTPHIHILTIARDEVKLFSAQDWDDYGLDMLDENGEYAFSVENLTWNEAFIEHQYYLLRPDAPEVPIDFLNDREQGWQCAKLVKPKDGKPGKYIATCPYFCHSPHREGKVVEDESGRLMLLDEAF